MNHWEHFEAKYGAPIGKGAQCRVYRQQDTVYKVLSDGHILSTAMHEGYALAAAEAAGIPVSNIHGVYTEGGHIVMEMDYVAGKTMTDLMAEAAERGDAAAVDAYLDELVALQVQLHSKPAMGLGDARRSYCAMVQQVPGIPDATRAKLLALLETLPDGDALCHNDFHPLNVISNNGKYIIIDWDSASIGDAAGDVAHSYIVCVLTNEALAEVYPDFAEKYLQKYIDKTQMDRKRIEAWFPIHAAILHAVLSANAPKDAAKMLPFFESVL